MIHARLYNRQSTLSKEVGIRFDGNMMHIEESGKEFSYDINGITFSSRLGNTPRLIYLPDGRVCETKENDAVDSVLKGLKRDRFAQLLHFAEHQMRYLVAALIVTVLSVYAFITYGLPELAKTTARQMPSSVVYRIDESTLASLDSTLLKPSKLPLSRQNNLKNYFLRYSNISGEWPKIRIFFRSGAGIGPNAFALPDGSIVFTDDLVRLAKDDRELLSVFFHELGHVQNRHALQRVLQDSAFYLLLSSLTGDITASGSVFATLPTMLVESGYSRDMELEADDYAFEMMRHNRIDYRYFTAFMSRLMQQTDEDNASVFRYLSDHPLTQFRIERFKQRGNEEAIR